MAQNNMNQTSNITQTAKGQIEYVLEGEGQTCLLLHGGHSNCFERLGTEEIFAAGMSALIPSRPGYGRTSESVGQSAAEAAASMVALLDQLSLEKVSVMAVSAGGPTALYLAALYPERVDKLVLQSAVSKPWLSPDHALYKSAKRIFHPRIQNMTWKLVRTFVNISPTLIYRQMIPSFSKLSTSAVLSSFTASDKATFKNMLLHLSSGSGFMLDIEHKVPEEILKQITRPTLIVHSQNDNSVSFEHARHAQQLISNSELFEAKTWGHLIWIGEGSREAKEKVATFLRET